MTSPQALVRTFAATMALALTGCATATPPPTDPAQSLLTWSPEQQLYNYRHMEEVYPAFAVKRGRGVHPLPNGRELPDAFDWNGQHFSVDRFMANYNAAGLLVIKNGQIRLERYKLGLTPSQRWIGFSVTKSVTSTLLGAAIADGKIKSLDEEVTTYLPDLKGSAYDGVTIRNLVTMTSGVKWNENYADPNSDVARAGRQAPDPAVKNRLIDYMKRLPREAPPGTKFVYKTGETDLAGLLVESAVGMTLSDYLSEKIWKPYGMEHDAIWVATDDHPRGGFGLAMTLRDFGRFGQFTLDDATSAKPVLPPNWFNEATVNQTNCNCYGYFWWTLPSGSYEAQGVYGQLIYVDPKQKLIIVILSAWPKASDPRGNSSGPMLYALRAALGLKDPLPTAPAQ